MKEPKSQNANPSTQHIISFLTQAIFPLPNLSTTSLEKGKTVTFDRAASFQTLKGRLATDMAAEAAPGNR